MVIEKSEKLIKQTIKDNSVTIVVTPTSSGKTMLLPAWLHAITGKRVHCTAPRVVMAKKSAASANQLVWRNSSLSAGYITGKGANELSSNAVIYITEGSLLNKIAAGFAPEALILDEAHEQGVLMEALLCKAKDLARGSTKVVIASATIDRERYAEYFESANLSVGTVELPKAQRAYSLDFEMLEGRNPAQVIAEQANAGKRCLVGVAGKRDIEEFASKLAQFGCKAPIFPFHGELEDEDFSAVDKETGAMVLIATNILQSGITIPEASVGYFQGKGKHRKGNKLISYTLSTAEMEQWYGRLGRTCNGLVYLDDIELERSAMPIPEIQRVPLESALLSLQSVGVELGWGKIGLLNEPHYDRVAEASDNLIKLGLFNNAIRITKLGKQALAAGGSFRGGLLKVKGREMGCENSASKIAALLDLGSPFRKCYIPDSWIKAGSKQSDLLIWRDAVQHLAKEKALMSGEQFRELCEDKGMYRRTLNSLIRAFAEIDAQIPPDTAQGAKPLISLIFAAFADCTDEFNAVPDAHESRTKGNGLRCGNILTIGISTFFEHVTYEKEWIYALQA